MNSSDPLSLIASLCGDGACPAIYLSDDGKDFIVRGRRLTQEEQESLDAGEIAKDEELVEIPWALIEKVFDKIRDGTLDREIEKRRKRSHS
jgi:hypothetical protein